MHGTGQNSVKHQFCVFRQIGEDDKSGSSFEARCEDEDQGVDEGDGGVQSPPESSENENEGDDETITSLSLTQLR